MCVRGGEGECVPSGAALDGRGGDRRESEAEDGARPSCHTANGHFWTHRPPPRRRRRLALLYSLCWITSCSTSFTDLLEGGARRDSQVRRRGPLQGEGGRGERTRRMLNCLLDLTLLWDYSNFRGTFFGIKIARKI